MLFIYRLVIRGQHRGAALLHWFISNLETSYVEFVLPASAWILTSEGQKWLPLTVQRLAHWDIFGNSKLSMSVDGWLSVWLCWSFKVLATCPGCNLAFARDR